MHKTARSYLISIMLTALTTTCVCAQDSHTSDTKITPPQSGDSLPPFQLTSTDYQTIDLHDILIEQPVVMIYYRGGW